MITIHEYPSLFAHVNAGAGSDRIIKALAVLSGGEMCGEIRNVEYVEAKRVISTAIEGAWGKLITDKYRYNCQDNQALNDLFYDINLYGISDVLPTQRKIAKSTATGEAVDAMNAFIEEVTPLVSLVASLKDKVIKGRKLNENKKPENPNKVVKTCPCCFRGIAVVGQLMAHHGYERPGNGWQTTSCPGIRFEPLEWSPNGLMWMIDKLKERLASLNEEYNSRNLKQRLTSMNIHRKPIEVTSDMPEWTKEFARYVYLLETQQRHISNELDTFKSKLEHWEPELQQITELGIEQDSDKDDYSI